MHLIHARSSRWTLLALPFIAGACTPGRAEAAPSSKANASMATAAPITDITALLSEAHGAPPAICAMAARSVESLRWQDAWRDAPSTPLRADQVTLRRIEDDAPDDDRGATPFTASELRLLLDHVIDPDPCARELSIRLLATTRRSAAAIDVSRALVEHLRSADEKTREAASFGIGLMSPGNATPALLSVLGDKSAAVRANAAWALGRIHDGRALSALMHATNDSDESVRLAAVTALGQLHSTASAAVLIRVLERDSVASVRRVAAWALSRLDTSSAARPLGQALRRDRDAAVREMCAWALGELKSRERIDDLLFALQQDPMRKVRETSAWALGQLHDARAVAGLSAVLGKDDDQSVRGTAAWAIGQLHVNSAPSGLVTALADPDDLVRFKASWALSEIRDDRSVSAVRAAFEKETHEGARRAQLRLLLAAGNQSEGLLKELLLSPDPQVREVAVRGVAGATRINPWPWPAPRPRPFP